MKKIHPTARDVLSFILRPSVNNMKWNSRDESYGSMGWCFVADAASGPGKFASTWQI